MNLRSLLIVGVLPTVLFAQTAPRATSPDKQALAAEIAPRMDATAPAAAFIADTAIQLAEEGAGPTQVYVVRATDGRRNRNVTGRVTVSVDGVPAEPVNSGAFNGVGHEPLAMATVWMVLDPANDSGTVRATWVDSQGTWTLSQTVHVAPPHPTALVISPDAMQTTLVTDPVQTHGYQHGNTGAGGPLMPTIFQHLASFGPAQVTLNGQPFLNPFDGPTAPAWFGAIKVTDGVRDALDGTVRNTTGGFYSPMNPADGATDPDDLELQVIFHDDPTPMGFPATFPPGHQFFYWLNFETVLMQVLQVD